MLHYTTNFRSTCLVVSYQAKARNRGNEYDKFTIPKFEYWFVVSFKC